MDNPAGDRWIVIPNWDKFQHYKNRDVVWIKDYLDQFDRDAYMELTLALRGLLSDLRKLFARRDGVLRGDTVTLSRALNIRVTERQLDSLVHAGFIRVSASKPLALTRARALAKRGTSYPKEGAGARAPANGLAPAPEEQSSAEPLRDPEALTRIRELANRLHHE